ncbi:MAG: TetR/AcrR family transcriptional regulator [Bifidobacteriaceae bacterium]|nr:TetR/AcrR family transcriptional regulator [Bifidobacteriaceae bacterium]
MPKGLTKKRDARLGAILEAAEALFLEKGYDASVSDILEKAGMGRGTFYHYFKSKEDVLEAVVDRLIDHVVEDANAIAERPDLDAHTKLGQVIAAVSLGDTPAGAIIDELHRPANAQMHFKSITETIRQVAPIMARVVEQGVAEGVYTTPRPLETIEFLLVANSAMFDGWLFPRTREQFAARAAEVARITELALGARDGSFAFLLEGLEGLEALEGPRGLDK